MPGTELAFDHPVEVALMAKVEALAPLHTVDIFRLAIFRQKDKHIERVHHDVLEFPNGSQTFLTAMRENQFATVLQLPAEPKTAQEAEEQTRAAYAG